MKKEAYKLLAEAFKNGGVESVYNFPGFYSHKVFEELGGKVISTNEKIAYESAFGSSLAGKRTLVTMKNVGLNVAADPFLHSLLSGINAGLVLLVTDDVQVVGSQERMDSRHYHDFYGGLWFDPNSLEQLCDIAVNSFELSEKLDLPIVIRLTNQVFSKAGRESKIKTKSHKKINVAKSNPSKYVVHPVYWRDQQKRLIKRNTFVQKYLDKYYKDETKLEYVRSKGVIVFGNCDKELKEIEEQNVDLLKLSTYPVPTDLIKSFLKNKNEINILEQGDNYGFGKIKDILSEMSIDVRLTSDTGFVPDLTGKWRIWSELKTFFKALKSVNPSYVVSDVTQFTVESESTVDACLSLGSAVATGMGLAESGVDYPFCIVGDTSFVHGGYLALREVMSKNIAMGIIIIDNGGSWCTGGQATSFSIYDLVDNKKVNQVHVDYNKATVKSLSKVLVKMKKGKKLKLVYLKI